MFQVLDLTKLIDDEDEDSTLENMDITDQNMVKIRIVSLLFELF